MIISLLGGEPEPGPITLAHDYWQQADYEQSLQYFRKALQQYPDQQIEIKYNMAQNFIKMEIYDSAQNYFESILPQFDDSQQSELYNLIGFAAVMQHQYREALLAFRQALVKDPSHNQAAFNYELLYKRLLAESSPPANDTRNPEGSSPPPSGLSNSIQNISGLHSSNNPTENDALTFFADSLNIIEALKVLEWIQKREYQYIQELKKSPKKLPYESEKPNW